MKIEDRSHLRLWNVEGAVGGNRETALVIASTEEEARAAVRASNITSLDEIATFAVIPMDEIVPIFHVDESGTGGATERQTAAQIIADWFSQGDPVIASSEDE